MPNRQRFAHPINPGEELLEWIVSRYKPRFGERHDSGDWLSAMAREFAMEDLERHLFYGTAFMLIRRLLANMDWYVTKNVDREKAYELFERDYLRGTFGIDRDSRLRLTSLVIRSFEASQDKIAAGVRRELHDKARTLNERCQISGCLIDYSKSATFNAFTLDHIWPHSLGGLSEAWNLRTSCYTCNSRRQNIVNASDTHFQHFHVHSSYSDLPQDNFWKQLNNEFRLAALMEANFQCEQCEMAVSKMDDGVRYVRRNTDENYNVFNIQVVCEQHSRGRL